MSDEIYKAIIYRLETLENRCDSSLSQLGSKIDLLLEHYTTARVQQAKDDQMFVGVEKRLDNVETRLERADQALVSVRISMAEKLALGGLGGGIIAGTIELIKYLASMG